MPEETEFEQAVADLTAPLRDAVVGRYVGAAKTRVGYPLDALLTAFATRHVVGMISAYRHLEDVADVPDLEFDPTQCSAGVVFVWAPLVTSMLFYALKTTANLEPRALRQVERGLAAASDRIALLAYEEGCDVVRTPGPGALPKLFARIASAYVTGVVLAHAEERDADGPDEWGPVRAALASLPARDRRLLEARYARGASMEEIAADSSCEVPEAASRIGAALRRIEVAHTMTLARRARGVLPP